MYRCMNLGVDRKLSDFSPTCPISAIQILAILAQVIQTQNSSRYSIQFQIIALAARRTKILRKPWHLAG
jgi:hypothetical protein